MSQYLSLLTTFVAFFVQHPEKAQQLWSVIVAAYEAAQRLADAVADTFGEVLPREAGVALTIDEEEKEREFTQLAGAPRGPFGNGKVLRWLLTTPEGQKLLGMLPGLIGGIGS